MSSEIDQISSPVKGASPPNGSAALDDFSPLTSHLSPRTSLLLLNQCFYPDVVSTAQHLTDLALELVEAGHSVTVVTSRRGYDDPSLRLPRRETWKGVSIVRIDSLALGKKSRWRRAVSFASFWISCLLALLRLPRHDVRAGASPRRP